MNVSDAPANDITFQEWTWVQNLIQDVHRDERRDNFSKNLWQWDLAVKQFRKVEMDRIILADPTETDWERQAICLHGLIAMGKYLLLEAKGLSDEELAACGITRPQLEAYLEELNLSLRERHYPTRGPGLKALQNKIFSGPS